MVVLVDSHRPLGVLQTYKQKLRELQDLMTSDDCEKAQYKIEARPSDTPAHLPLLARYEFHPYPHHNGANNTLCYPGGPAGGGES